MTASKDIKNLLKKYNLPFSLVSDENQEVVKAYGVWGLKKFMGRVHVRA